MGLRDLDSDYLKELHEFSIYLDHNTIYLESSHDDGDANEVTWHMARRFRKNVRLLADTMVEQEEDQVTMPIIVDIDTPGGCVVSGMNIINTVQACPVRIIGYVSGQASSMGCAILQGFKERVLSPYAYVMWHSGTVGLHTPGQEFEHAARSDVAYGKMLNDFIYARVVEKQPNLSRDDFEIAIMKGLYFHNPQDAIDYGLADRIADRPK